MERSLIEQKLRDFIDCRLMEGQGAGLTPATPLFEFGILDSFALFSMLSFITDEFKVSVPLESLRTEDFENVSTIAGLVASKLAAAS
jgi:acyl carrier protein